MAGLPPDRSGTADGTREDPPVLASDVVDLDPAGGRAANPTRVGTRLTILARNGEPPARPAPSARRRRRPMAKFPRFLALPIAAVMLISACSGGATPGVPAASGASTPPAASGGASTEPGGSAVTSG